MPKPAALAVAFLFSLQLYSQKIEKEIVGQDWRIIYGLINNNLLLGGGNGRFPGPGEQYTKIMVSPTEVVVLTHTHKEEYAVRKINSQLQVVWTTPLTSFPLFLGQVNGNILVITADSKNGLDWKNDYVGTLFDAKTGTLLLKKNLYKGNEDFVWEPKLLSTPTPGEFYFGIRETGYKKGLKIFPYGIGANKALDKYNVTTAFTFFTVNDKLEIIKTVKLPVNESDVFISCDISTNKYLLVASTEENNIKVEKFDLATGKSAGKLTATIDGRNNWDYLTNLYVSKVQPDKAFLTVEYMNSEKDKTLALFQLNFSTKKVIRDEQIYDKSYKKSFKQDFSPSIKNPNKPDFDNLEQLTFTNVAEYNNRLIVFKEIKFQQHNGQSGSKSATRYYSRDGMITVYDEKLKIVSQQLIPKRLTGFFGFARSSSMSVKDDKVHIVSGMIHNSFKFGALYTLYNLKNGQVEKYEELSKDIIPKSHPADSPGTLWFDDGFIVHYLDQENAFVPRFTSNLQKISY